MLSDPLLPSAEIARLDDHPAPFLHDGVIGYTRKHHTIGILSFDREIAQWLNAAGANEKAVGRHSRFRSVREDVMNLLGRALFATAICAGFSVSASAQEIQERTIRWGHLNNTDHPVSMGVQKFAEILLAKSGGKMKVREFAASQLGNELQQQSALRGGTQEMLSASTTSLATVVPEFGLIDFPFLFNTTEQADALGTGAFGKAMLDTLPAKGLVGLGYWGLGFRNVTNSTRPITKLEDFSGLKLRVIPNPVYLETFAAFKANPVPMAFGELYSALETRTVDGQENPYTVILSNKFYEVQKYVSATNHTFTLNIILVSKAFWDKLSPAEQQLMREAYEESRGYQKEQTRIQTEKALAELQAKGMQYNPIAPEETDRMRKTAQPVVEKISANLRPETVKLFNQEVERIRKEVK
jgi:tripartite ATP-independent transporter DctP family solute receptor